MCPMPNTNLDPDAFVAGHSQSSEPSRPTASMLQSHLRPYMSSNAALPESDFHSLTNFQQTANTTLSTLEAEYARLGQQIQDMRLTAEQFRTVLSPLRRLPMELLLKIIRHAATDGLSPFDCYVSDTGRFEGPWVCSQVSQEWREATLAMPELWSRIDISSLRDAPQPPSVLTTEDSETEKLEAQLDYLSLILDRGGSHPLTLSFGVHPSHDMATGIVIMDLLRDHEERWFSLDLILTDDLLEMVLDAECPNLQFATITYVGSRGVIFPGLKYGMSLRHLALWNLHVMFTLDLPDTLTSLFIENIKDMRMYDALELLRYTPQLQTLRMSVSFCRGPAARVVPVTLPHLRKLDYTFSEVGETLNLLHNITTSSLQVLHGVTVTVASAPVIYELIERSRCQLQDVAFSCPEPGPDQDTLQSLLHQWSSVTKLRLCELQDMAMSFIRHLDQKVNDDIYFPALETLTLHMPYPHVSSKLRMGIESLQRFVETRLRLPNCRLNEVVFAKPHSGAVPAQLEFAKSCRESGLRVSYVLPTKQQISTSQNHAELRKKRIDRLPLRAGRGSADLR